MKNKILAGHLAALCTITVWGTSFISTKLLLADFSPTHIMLFRLTLALLALLLFYPHPLKGTTWLQELTFAGAGLCGVTLYFLLENVALTRTMAANVSVIVSLSPFFLALLAWALDRTNALRPRFFLGFALAITGVFLLSFSGTEVALSPAGDLLALGAAIVWAFYSLLVKRIAGFGFHIIQTTRRIFFYGLLFLLPVLALQGEAIPGGLLAKAVNWGNVLYLGLGASAVCFATWNWAVKILGPVKTSAYIYLNPVITVITSTLVLHERLTPPAGLGAALALAGLLLSES